MMQSCHPLRDDFNFIPFGNSSEQSSFQSNSDCKDNFDGGSFYSSCWDQKLDAIKDLVTDTDSSILPQLVPKSKDSKVKSPSIFVQLQNLYHEEIQKNNHAEVPNSRPTSYLLDKLVEKERFNMIVLTLYPISEGYSLCYRSSSGEMSEEVKYTYCRGEELLEYIEREQLPTAHLEYWEAAFPQLFYDGCVIARVRDRRSGPAAVRHVLLRPHTQSLIGDVNRLLASRAKPPSDAERFAAECDVVNNAQRPLCLDPSPRVGARLLKLHRDLHAFDTTGVRSLLRRSSRLVQHRKREHDSNPSPLAEFVRRRGRPPPRSTQRLNRNPAPQPSQSRIPIQDIIRAVNDAARPLDPLPDTIDFSPQVVEEWVLETDRDRSNKTYYVQLTILQHPANLEYLGQLYVDTVRVEGRPPDGRACQFTLGSRAIAERYIRKFIEIFTKEGRESVRITRLVPEQQPYIIHTSDLLDSSRPLPPPTPPPPRKINPHNSQPRHNDILQVLSLIINDARSFATTLNN